MRLWNPSIIKAQRYLYSRDTVIRSKGQRVAKIGGVDTKVKIKESVSRDIDIRMFSKLFIIDDNDDQLLKELAAINIRRFFSLKPMTVKVLMYIISKVRYNEDFIVFSNNDCMLVTNLSYNSTRIAIRELLEKEFIFDSYREKEYWIDCTFFYNGSFEKKSDEYLNAKK